MARLSENVPDNLIDHHCQFCRYSVLLDAIDNKLDDCFSDISGNSELSCKLEDLQFLVNCLSDYLDIQKLHLESLINHSHNGYLMPK